MKIQFRFLLLCTLFSFNAYSQKGWSAWQKLYIDDNISVEIQIYYSAHSCEQGGKTYKYKYRVNGYVTSDEKFVTWKMSYLDCTGNSFYEQNSIAIGGQEAMGTLGNSKLIDAVIYDPSSSTFSCSSLIKAFYDVLLSDTKITIRSPETSAIDDPKNSSNETDDNNNADAEITGWTDWQKLYSDNNITVEIQFFHSNNSCEDGGKPFKFKYKLNGLIVNNVQFVTWKMNFISCNNESWCDQNSIAIGGPEAKNLLGSSQLINALFYDQLNSKFTCSSLLEPFSDVFLSTSKITSSMACEILLSKAPKSIEGNTNLLPGQSTSLEVKGGLLGVGATWVWYKDECGTKELGNGESMLVKPTETTLYYVRAVGQNNTTTCATITINVDNSSVAATGITAKAKICKGESNVLTVEGGRLGPDAEWVWYSLIGIPTGSMCEGTFLSKGNSVTVAPTETTTYYARAEGKVNITSCVTSIVQVFENSLAPSAINASTSTTICEGTTIGLQVSGGQLSGGAEWKWYSGSCGSSSIASGSYVLLTPTNSTTYFVRAEGFCNKTNCASISIIVNKKSVIPGYIAKPQLIYRNKKATLELKGGSLGKQAEWYWYKGSCGSGKLLGKGTSLIIKAKKETEFYVQAKGLCNQTNCVSVFISPTKMHHWEKNYSNTFRKIMQAGVGGGLEWLQFPVIGHYSVLGVPIPAAHDSAKIMLSSLGIKIETPLVFFMNSNLNIAFIPSYSLAILRNDSTGDVYTSMDESHYAYQKIQIEAELAGGFKVVKLLVKYKLSAQTNTYQEDIRTNDFNTNTTKREKYLFDRRIATQAISAGIRIGNFSLKSNSNNLNMVDVICILSRNNLDSRFATLADKYWYLASWDVGAGINWNWKNKVKFQFSMATKRVQDKFDFDTINFDKAAYLASLVYTINWFY